MYGFFFDVGPKILKGGIEGKNLNMSQFIPVQPVVFHINHQEYRRIQHMWCIRLPAGHIELRLQSYSSSPVLVAGFIQVFFCVNVSAAYFSSKRLLNAAQKYHLKINYVYFSIRFSHCILIVCLFPTLFLNHRFVRRIPVPQQQRWKELESSVSPVDWYKGS